MRGSRRSSFPSNLPRAENFWKLGMDFGGSYVHSHPLMNSKAAAIPYSPKYSIFLGLGFTCSLELTSEAMSKHLANWFAQGPRILAELSDSLEDTHHPGFVVSHINKRRFQIRLLKTDSEFHSYFYTPDIPYIFIDLLFMRQNAKDHSITLPEIYLSTDPQGAKQGTDCRWRNYYKLEVIDIGDSGLFVSRVNLEMACHLQEHCGLRTASLDTTRFLKQKELKLQMINDEAIANVLSDHIETSVSDCIEDCPVT
ncbi:hypothetical protein F5146DRAFT_660895 [Armillaria mellea]|nr:hypothetical protein F5146DRAFT_660895 [Armillaria mellea]